MKQWGAVFLVYFLLAAIALAALWFQPNTVGDTLPHDYYHMHWGYWWMRHALSEGVSIYETNYVHFPTTTNLAFHTLSPFWYPLWMILEPFIGTVPAVNAIMTLALALAGFFCCLLLRVEGVQMPLALAGGVIFMLTPANLFSVMLTNLNYLGVFWLPVTLLLWRGVRYQVSAIRYRVLGIGFWGTIYGVALWGMLLTDLQWGLFSAFLLVPYGVWTLWQVAKQGWRDVTVLILVGMAALLTAVALLWFMGPLPHILTYDRGSFSPQPIDKAAGVPFPEGFATRLDPYARALSYGWLILPLTGIALIIWWRKQSDDRVARRAPRRVSLRMPLWIWLSMAIVPLVLSVGPFVTIGTATVAMPYVWLHEALGGMFRVPARFAPVAILPLVVFVGGVLSGRVKKKLIQKYKGEAGSGVGSLLIGGALILVVLLDGRVFAPMPVRPVVTQNTFYEQMGRETHEYVVVEIPVAGGSGEAWVGDFRAMETQFSGMTHGQRMINGTFARAPLDHFWHWLYDDPMLAWLGQRRWLEPEVVEVQLREHIWQYPIGYAVLHQDLVGMEANANQEIIGYFNRHGDLFCPPVVEGAAVAWRTRWHPDGCASRVPPEIAPGTFEIDLGSSGDERFIGWGWHRQEDVGATGWRWAGNYPRIGGDVVPEGGYLQAELFVQLPPGTYRVTLLAQAFHEPRMVTFSVNNQDLFSRQVNPDVLDTYTFELPVELIDEDGDFELVIQYDGAITPEQAGMGGDTRRLAIAVDSVRFERLD
jgi:hypothetical protein